MRRSWPAIIVLTFTALLGAGCIFLTRFDDGTQPCDTLAAPGQQCLSGSACVDGLCVSADAGVSVGDGGR
jgi:hypothetical protein